MYSSFTSFVHPSFKEPSKFYEKIKDFRRRMINYSSGHPVKTLPESTEAYLRQSEIYETMFKPEVVWMVDHQLPGMDFHWVGSFQKFP